MLWRKRRPVSDMDAEIESHLALEADQLRESGVCDDEATARRNFGNITSLKEALYERDHSQLWDQLSRDTRHALRLLWRRPAFSAIVVLTLAVGISAVLLRPLPYKDPSRLAMLWSEDSAQDLREGRVSLLNFADWRSRSHAFEDMTLFMGQTFLLGGNDGTTERMRAARVSANFFPLLGAEPALGRVFLADEERRGEAVVVISNSLWQRASVDLRKCSELV